MAIAESYLEQDHKLLPWQAAFEKTQKILKEAPTISDFADHYPAEEIAVDERLVTEFEQVMKRRDKERAIDPAHQAEAQVLEAIIYEESEMSDLLGPESSTVLTSKFDDYFNHTDCAVEFGEPDEKGQAPIIALDVTVQKELGGKFATILKELRSGTLTSLKYFESARGDKGSRDFVPRVIVGCDRKLVPQIAYTWMNFKQQMAEHPLQLLILNEIRIQLESQYDYINFLKKGAVKRGEQTLIDRYTIASTRLEEIMSITKKISKDKETSLPNGMSDFEDDPVYREIKSQAHEIDSLEI